MNAEYSMAMRLAVLVFLPLGCCSCRTIDAFFAYGEIRSSMSEPRTAGPARLDLHNGLPIVHLYGSPAEMGRQYGQLMQRPLKALHRFVQGMAPDLLKERLLNYAAAHETDLPDEMRAELTEMAHASGVPYVELVALNIVPKMACSALAVWDDSNPADARLIMGRNAEYFSMGLSDRGMMLVIRHPDKGKATASVAFLGMIGAFTGMNQSGVAYGNMLVFNADGPPSNPTGLPIQLAMQIAAVKSGSADEMSSRLRTMRHVIPMNAMVADATHAIVLELGLSESRARMGDGVLVSTNYFLSELLREEAVTCPRYDSLMRSGLEHRSGMTVEQMEHALHAARIHGLNLQAVVFEPAKMRMHVSINKVPASAGPYVDIELNQLFQLPPADHE